MTYCSARTLAIVLALIGVACSQGPTAPTPMDRRFTLAPGETAQLAEAGVSIRFDGVTGDCAARAMPSASSAAVPSSM